MLTIESPPGRWLRLSQGARRLGLTRDLLIAEAPRLNCRLRSLGVRGLLHVSESDIDRAAVLLAGTTSSAGAKQ